VARTVSSLLPRRRWTSLYTIRKIRNYKHTEVLFIIELRLDGGAAIRIPGDVILDDGLHSEMLAYTRHSAYIRRFLAALDRRPSS